MGLEIRTICESEPIPRRTVLVLSCDSVSGFFCRGKQEFNEEGGYIENMAAAKRAGWVERQSGQGRIFVCAGCK